LAEHRAEQVAVPSLRAGAGKAGRDLRVEHVVQLRVPRAAQDRDVLAPGVQDDVDRGVAEQRGERSDVGLRERVDQDDLRRSPRVGIVDRDLDEAQEGPVSALRHELCVDSQPS
jgi:hypothetical protein